MTGHDDRHIEVSSLSKTMGAGADAVQVLVDIDIHVDRGEFVTIIGPSGCGKSTLLNTIAGLDDPTLGSVALAGSGSRRLGEVAYMQQKDLLLPWRTVLDNAILGLEVCRVPRDQARAKAMGLMDQFGLSGFERYYPAALSGGMRQRAAFLRTILAERDILLLDEPFGALDALTRGRMQEWLLDLWAQFRKTVVLVTHDVDEAIFLSDRIYVLTARPGKVRMETAVGLPRPRRYEMMTDPAFVNLKASLLKAIRDETIHSETDAWS